MPMGEHVNLIVFAWLFVRSPQHRWPVVIMLTGIVRGACLLCWKTVQIIQSECPRWCLST